jgi:hypothetical protein
MLSDTDLENLIQRAISFYNRTHSPNAVAKLIFCTGCGTMEITEAFADQTKTLSQGRTELKHNKTIQTNPHAIQTNYTVKTK